MPATATLTRMVPIMAEIVKKHPEFQFGVAALEGIDSSHYQPLKQLPEVKFIVGDTYNLLHVSKAAVVTSGTATLETGLFKVPQVCVYKAGWLEMSIAKAVVKVKFISLINLIAGKEVIRELIQEQATVREISEEVKRLVVDNAYRSRIQEEYKKIYHILDTGSASENAARLMVGYLKNDV